MRVVAMFRVSTERQANEGASLDAQERIYRELAARSGWTTVAEFRGCESATQAATERRVLQQVLAAIREHAPDALYAHEQSRVTRGDELDVALLLRELRERRTKIIIGGVVRDLASLDERFVVGIQAVVDRAEAERIKERLMRGKRERARQGKKNCGPAPFGYRNPRVGEAGRGTLQIVPEEAAIVRRIFALAESGKGTRAIAQVVEAEGVRGPRGRPFGKTSLARILSNPVYIGTAASNVWVAEKGTRNFRFQPFNADAILVEDAHEPIVDRAVWDAVHKRPALPRTSRPRLLSGFLWVNGRRYGGDSSRGQPVYCSVDHGDGRTPWLPVGLVDEGVWAALVKLATEPEFVSKMVQEAERLGQKDRIADQIAVCEQQASRYRKRLARLVDMRADGEISKETFNAKTEETRRALAGLESQHTALQAGALACDATHVSRAVRALQSLLAGKARLTTGQRRQVLRSFASRIDVGVSLDPKPQPREPNGRLKGKPWCKWVVDAVTFHLVPHPVQDAGDKAPSSWSSALATASGRSRVGHKDQSYSCSGLRARARR